MSEAIDNTELRKLVRTEILSLLASAGGVDLGTIYRTVAELVPDAESSIIATSLSAMMREKRIAIQTRQTGKDGAVVGTVVLTASPGRPADDRVTFGPDDSPGRR